MARFYGFGDAEMESMLYSKFDAYYRGVDIMEARESMLGFEVSAYPHYSKNHERKEAFETKKRRFKNGFSTPGSDKPASYGDVIAKIKGFLGGR